MAKHAVKRKNITNKKVWKDTQGNSEDRTIKVPSGTGERSILYLIISEEDFFYITVCLCTEENILKAHPPITKK